MWGPLANLRLILQEVGRVISQGMEKGTLPNIPICNLVRVRFNSDVYVAAS